MTGQKINVLLIEDNQPDREMIQTLLSSAEDNLFSVTRARTLSEGTDFLRQRPFDIVLLDFMLQDSSEELIHKWIKSQRIPVVILSSLEDQDAIARALRQGAQDFLIKTRCDKDMIKRSLLYACDRWTACQQKLDGICKVSEGKFRNLFDQMPSGVAIYDALPGCSDFIIKDLNRAGEEISKVQKKDIVGKNLLSVFPSVKKNGLWDVLVKVWKTGQPCHLPPFLYEDGRLRHWTDNYVFKLPSGEVVSGYNDITDKKNADKKLSEVRRQIELILGLTKTNIDIIDADFNLNYVDPHWQEIYENPEGRKCYEYFMGRQERCEDCGILDVFENKASVVTEEVLPREGNRPIQVTTTPFQDDNGQWLVAEVNVDISERKKVEEKIKQNLEDLQLFKKLAIDREKNMIDLKKEVNRLSKELNKPEPYDLSFLE